MMNVAPLLAALLLCACSGSDLAASPSSSDGISAIPGSALTANAALKVPAGFTLSVVAKVASPHGLAFLPDGDLLVGSGGSTVSLVPQADGVVGVPHVFATFPDSPSYGVAFAGEFIYVATQFALWQIRYHSGDQTASATTKIAAYRQGPIAPHSDGDVHRSASVAVDGTHVFVGVGSSCNACVEVDPTRATVLRADLDGKGLTTAARRLRNALALAVNPEAEALWAGGAGQDSLPIRHPYEFLDSVTLHPGTPDYGWPECEENRHAYTAGAECASTVAPRIELPAYSTIMGAVFYPSVQHGRYAFPARYRGGLFISAHGSWHVVDGHLIPPHVVFVPMAGNSPVTPVDWNDPTKQWTDFLSGFQDSSNNRIGRSTGVTVGPNGSLFVSDDQTGNIYRIRPT
jgi:glucose/arabinose dehydrogenase